MVDCELLLTIYRSFKFLMMSTKKCTEGFRLFTRDINQISFTKRAVCTRCVWGNRFIKALRYVK